jgi:ATP:ADP antiporter, AAA family
MESRPAVRNPLSARLFGLFGQVRSDETLTVLLMLSNIFLILVCYYVIKTVREPLVLLEGGAVGKSYAAAGQALILMAFIPCYGWFSSRVDRFKLIVGVTLFFVVNIELFSLAVAAGLPHVGVLFFIWVGFFSLTVIAQFWSYANDIYTEEAGKRLFPVIGIGMTAGAPVGAFLAGHLFATGIHPQAMLHISTALLLVSLGCYAFVDRKADRKGGEKKESKPALAPGNGFALVLRSRYISLIALFFVLLNVVNTTGEFILGSFATSRAANLLAQSTITDESAYLGQFYGNFYFWVNVVAVVVQAFLVSRIVKYGGLRWTLLILPLVSLGAYGTIAAGAGLLLVRWAKTAENATDYSVMNTARQLIWLPTTREEKYKAKQAVDTFFVRAGDVLSAAFVFVGTTLLGLSASGFAAGNILAVVAWIGVGLLILREYRRLTAARLGVEGLGISALQESKQIGSMGATSGRVLD